MMQYMYNYFKYKQNNFNFLQIIVMGNTQNEC